MYIFLKGSTPLKDWENKNTHCIESCASYFFPFCALNLSSNNIPMTMRE